MNYKTSELVLKSLAGANKVLLSCHKSPDLDSVCSVLAVASALRDLGKEYLMITPGPIPKMFKFLPRVDQIEEVNMDEFDFTQADLWLQLDGKGYSHFGYEKQEKPQIDLAVIDHHPGVTDLTEAVIHDPEASSVCEMLYFVFEDWDVGLTKDLANVLLAGISSDSNYFTTTNTRAKSHYVAWKLMDIGADNNLLVTKIMYSNSEELLHIWGEFLKNINVEKDIGFVWSAVPLETYKKYPAQGRLTSSAIDQFLRSIDGTRFAVAMMEKSPGNIDISFRSRDYSFDVSEIAKSLGGGGHKVASGASVSASTFDEAVNVVVAKCRTYAKEN